MKTLHNRPIGLRLMAGVVAGFIVGLLVTSGAGAPSTTRVPSAAARLAAAERVCRLLHDEVNGTPWIRGSVESTHMWSLRRAEAQRDVDLAQGNRSSALEAHLQRMRDLAAQIKKLNSDGLSSKYDVASTDFYIAEAEEFSAREKASYGEVP